MKMDSSTIQNIYLDLCNHYGLLSRATMIHTVIAHPGYSASLQECTVNINCFPMFETTFARSVYAGMVNNHTRIPKIEHKCKFKDTFGF